LLLLDLFWIKLPTQVDIPQLKQEMQIQLDAEAANVNKLTVERDELLAARSAMQAAVSELQQELQLFSEKEKTSQKKIFDLELQLQEMKEDHQAQSAKLSSQVEVSAARLLEKEQHDAASLLAASNILDQLQMTNESCQDYGKSLPEVSVSSRVPFIADLRCGSFIHSPARGRCWLESAPKSAHYTSFFE
jgi:predicted nuclease with TOPRIM domain